MEETLGLRFGEDLEAGIHPGFDGALAKQVGAEAVDGRDVGFFQVGERVFEELGDGLVSRAEALPHGQC